MKTFFRYVFFILVTFFALIGVAFSAVFVAMQLGLLNVRGTIQERNQFFYDAFTEANITQTATSSSATTTLSITATTSTTTTQTGGNTRALDTPCTDPQVTSCVWNMTPEWAVIKSALVKDAGVLERVSQETGVSKRMIAALVFPEQARFFTSNREVFKRWFEPMKILGSLSQFSLGVSGIKQETAARIEEYAADSSSPFYPGVGMFELVAHATTTDPDTSRFNRLTDEDDHYFSYLYTALFIKEIQSQWGRAGFDITANPEVVVTLFNLGFDKSLPHANPAAGGAPITLGNSTCSYGILGGLFYRSEELADVFPK